MVGSLVRWLILAVLTTTGGTGLALALNAKPMAADLEMRLRAALGEPSFAWIEVAVVGRDAVLTGTAETSSAIEEARRRAAGVYGVRAVTSAIGVAPVARPYPLVARLVGDGIELTGGYPDEAARLALLATDRGIDDQRIDDRRRHLAGAPDVGALAAAAEFGLDLLAQMDQGEVALSDLALSVRGRARSLEAFGDLDGLIGQAPPGVTLAQTEILPPKVTPYVWTARHDGRTVTISGLVPEMAFVERLRGAVRPGVTVATTLLPASGAPKNFSDKALVLLSNLLMLDRGEASVRDEILAISGVPASAEIADSVTRAVAALGGTATLEPPPVADYRLTVRKQGGKLTVVGNVPDQPTYDRLAGLAGVEISRLALGRGAPDRFASGLDFGLLALGRLNEGRFLLRGDEIVLDGRAGTGADYRKLLEMIAEGAPQGLRFGEGTLRPPVALPYVFSASMAEGEGVRLSGYLPDQALPQAIMTGNVIDETEVADGAPPDFAAAAAAGVAALGQLRAGELAFDGRGWRLSGTAADAGARGRALAALPDGGGGWQIAVSLSAPPAAAPFAEPKGLPPDRPAEPEAAPTAAAPLRFLAQKRPGQPIHLEGAVPTAAVAAYFGLAAGGVPVRDLTETPGLPADFALSGGKGLDLLVRLTEGALRYEGGHWALDGRADLPATRDRVLGDIADFPAPADWSATIDLMPSVEACRMRVAAAARRGAIAFRSGRADLVASSQILLDEIAAGLALCPRATIQVEGHTDADGPEADNLALSVARAEAVVAELIRRGIDMSRLYAVGYGESLPLVPNDTQNGKAQNRRIDFAISRD